jgi:hypothetical protein
MLCDTCRNYGSANKNHSEIIFAPRRGALEIPRLTGGPRKMQEKIYCKPKVRDISIAAKFASAAPHNHSSGFH